MRRLVHLAFVFALMASGDAHAMSYGLAAFQNGSTVIVAEGRIHRNEAARLLSFLQATATGCVPRTLVISSPGGELLGAVWLGQILRQLGIRTVVGSIAAVAYGQATLGAGRCHSACVFALMGAPNLERVGLIWQPANSGSAQGQKDLDAAAPRLGLSVVSIPLHTPGDVERVFATVREMRPQALVIHPTPIVGRVYNEIAAFTIAERLPTITGNSAFAREGLLMSYGPDWAAQWRLAAHYTDQLLRGAKVADLPVQQPTRFELVLNLRTARALGMEPPDTLLARADEEIG